MPGFAKNMILKEISSWLHEEARSIGCSEAVIKAWDNYYISTLKRPGMIDNLQQAAFYPPGVNKSPLQGTNRLGNPACTFPIAMSFGDQDFLCSETGAEDILKMNLEFSGG